MRLASYPSQPVVGVSLHQTLLLHGTVFLLFSYFFVVFTVKPWSRDYYFISAGEQRFVWANSNICIRAHHSPLSESVWSLILLWADWLSLHIGIFFFFLLFSSGFLAACPAQGSTQLSVLQMRFSVESKGWNSENKSQQKQVVLQFNDLGVWLCLVVSIWNEQQPTYTHNTRVHTLAQRIGLTN